MEFLLEPLRYAFMRQALVASILVSVTCSLLGVYVVHRRMAFLGDAIAHTTLPGLVIAYLNRWSLFAGAIIAALCTAIGVGWVSRRRQIREDTAIGVIFSGMFALGVVLISRTRSYRDFSHMLFGNVLGVSRADVVGISIVATIVLIMLWGLRKELMLTTVDPTHAQVIGLSAERMRYILLILLALAVVTAIQTVGVVLTSAMLVTPAATASLLTDHLRRLFLLSAAVSVFSSVVGLYLSWHLALSSGGAIVLVCTSCFGVAAIVRAVWGRFQAKTKL